MNRSKQIANWDISFSLLRSIACVAIVVLHTMTYALIAARTRGEEISSFQATGATLVQCSMMWAVPVFVMVTGALLLPPQKELSWEKLWGRYFARVGKVLLFFGAFFLIFDLLANGPLETAENSSFFASHPRYLDGGDGVSLSYVILCGAIDILSGHSWAHMWYLYMLLGLYLLMPFYKKISENSTSKEIRFLLFVYVFFLCLVPLLGLGDIATDFRFSVATIYPFYLFFGYASYEGLISIPKRFAVFLLVVSSGSIWFAVWAMSSDYSSQLGYFTSYNSLPVIVQSGSIFSLMTSGKNIKTEQNVDSFVTRSLLDFDCCTFGIYLIHLLVIKLMLRYMKLTPFEHLWEFPVVVIAAILFSYFVVKIYKTLQRSLL